MATSAARSRSSPVSSAATANGPRARGCARDAARRRAARRRRSARSRPSSRSSRASGSAIAPTAERAWMTVLEVEPDAADAFEALIGDVPRRAALERSARAARAPRRGHDRSAVRLADAARSSRSSRRRRSATRARPGPRTAACSRSMRRTRPRMSARSAVLDDAEVDGARGAARAPGRSRRWPSAAIELRTAAPSCSRTS